MTHRISTDDLRRAVALLSTAAKQPLTLDGAFGGWRVEDARSQNFLGTGYLPKKQLYDTIHAVLQFHRTTAHHA